MDWQAALTDQFLKARKKLKDKKVRNRIDTGIHDILSDPYHNSKVLVGLGYRSRRFGKYRILYQICEDCRLRGVEDMIGCANCDQTPDNTVVFLAFGLRKNVYDR
ncbi:MAG: type II toxin-antitoxin system RelE/ParE family toxin [Candidatus Thorarchaeota archaeon]|nr:type II toxin-antitoxin system RelE/ParE family toxin [Candidatus Thorarchaeota archaeon]